MAIQGLHHITLVCSNAQKTIDFYTGVLGLRLVKKTVNFDDPGSYHLYFGDETGRPGTAITYFEWANAPKGRPGIGGTHHYALRVADMDGLLKWKRRLTDLGHPVDGPYDRHYFTSIYFRDPDGVIIEIATDGPGWTVDESTDQIGAEYREPPPDMIVRNRDEDPHRGHDLARAGAGNHPGDGSQPGHAPYHGHRHRYRALPRLFGVVLGLRRVKMTSNFDDPTSAHWYWGSEDGRPGTLITILSATQATPAITGCAWASGRPIITPSVCPTTRRNWPSARKLISRGYRVSPVMDRIYFKSIYTSDPDGHIVELATAGPGFLVDEDRESLGQALKLPSWLEVHRSEIEAGLSPASAPAWSPAEVGSATEVEAPAEDRHVNRG